MFDYCVRMVLKLKDGTPSIVPIRPSNRQTWSTWYVLNVIEDASERAEVLRKAFSLTQRLLIVAVRVDQSLEKATPFADGVITGRGAFQKLYSQSEFRAYLKETLGVQPVMASLGVAYVFQDSGREAEYVAGTASTKSQSWLREALDSFKRDRIARRFLKLAANLGRPPLPEEFPSFTKLNNERFGTATANFQDY